MLKREACKNGLSSVATFTTEFQTVQEVKQALKNSRGISETKRHNQTLEMSQRCVECHFPLVPFSDADKVVVIPEVKFNKHWHHGGGQKQH